MVGTVSFISQLRYDECCPLNVCKCELGIITDDLRGFVQFKSSEDVSGPQIIVIQRNSDAFLNSAVIWVHVK